MQVLGLRVGLLGGPPLPNPAITEWEALPRTSPYVIQGLLLANRNISVMGCTGDA
jgi:hypothetical protein